MAEDESKIAKITLTNLHKRIQRAKISIGVEQQDIESMDSFEEDCVQSGMQRTFQGDPSNNRTSPCDDNIDDLFDAYEKVGRIHNKKLLLEFWEEKADEHSVLYELAKIIHAIPPSQCSVERSFSALSYLYNSRRTKLAPVRLEDLLFLYLNRDIVEKIHERDLNALKKKNNIK